ncbi:MAG: hypothetical protein A3I16_04850 [Burkholderiales bacterium RIFCSPLOWO2_02_FULL_66_35]|nr:MAG: hypothetical protein A3I16_04850 [Burkholderiales bacterium RIFCSPLOWO2_02_FULL_66_35]
MTQGGPSLFMAPRPVKALDLVVVVAGPRVFKNRAVVWQVMDLAHRHKRISTVVHGGTPGTEQLAAEWAERIGLSVTCCPADWAHDQEVAPLRQHLRMIEEYKPDGVIIFPGTLFGDDLAARAGSHKIPVWFPKVPQR